jgi:hypothetical protein
MSHTESRSSNITVVQRVIPALRVRDQRFSGFLAKPRDFASSLPLGCASTYGSLRLKSKTGAYSPPRFSAPALKGPPETGKTRPLIYFRPTCWQSKRRVCKAKWMKSSVIPRCLAAARLVNEKGGRSIYLVDSKQGGIDSTRADVYCAELEQAGLY